MGNGIIRGCRYRFQFDRVYRVHDDFAHGAVSDRDAINLAARYRKYRSLMLGLPLKGRAFGTLIYAAR